MCVSTPESRPCIQMGALNAESFVRLVRDHLAPYLRPSDNVLLDNLKAHRALDVHAIIERRRHLAVPGGPHRLSAPLIPNASNRTTQESMAAAAERERLLEQWYR